MITYLTFVAIFQVEEETDGDVEAAKTDDLEEVADASNVAKKVISPENAQMLHKEVIFKKNKEGATKNSQFQLHDSQYSMASCGVSYCESKHLGLAMSRIIKFAFSFRHAPLKHFMYLEKLESEAWILSRKVKS